MKHAHTEGPGSILKSRLARGLFPLVAALLSFALAAPAFGVEISPILEGKLAAFSFTYDDGAYSHYTTALPTHLKYGLPATFLIITDRVEPGEIWLRLKPGEKVSVNGKDAVPNASGAVLAHAGDTIAVR